MKGVKGVKGVLGTPNLGPIQLRLTPKENNNRKGLYNLYRLPYNISPGRSPLLGYIAFMLMYHVFS